jgi:hypothetical protein
MRHLGDLANRKQRCLVVYSSQEEVIAMKGTLALFLAALLAFAGCSKANADVDPKAIEAKYGLSGGYVDEISTEDGKIKATIIPTTLDDGRKVQLVIPHQPMGDHQVYMRDGIEITPMELSDPKVSKQQFVESQPRIVERRPAAAATPATAPAATAKKKRSLEKEILIVGGSAGAGAAIGAIAGGGKGAGIGALSGGVAGLVYDMATKNKK